MKRFLIVFLIASLILICGCNKDEKKPYIPEVKNDDFVFEDLMGYSICGMEADEDTLWFNIHTSGEDVYIVSWEYTKNAGEHIKNELSQIAQTFKLSK